MNKGFEGDLLQISFLSLYISKNRKREKEKKEKKRSIKGFEAFFCNMQLKLPNDGNVRWMSPDWWTAGRRD